MFEMASYDVDNDVNRRHYEGVTSLRTTVNLDDELLAQAKAMTGITENASLIRHAVERLIEHEAARRLVRLGGTMPGIEVPERRRQQRVEGSVD